MHASPDPLGRRRASAGDTPVARGLSGGTICIPRGRDARSSDDRIRHAPGGRCGPAAWSAGTGPNAPVPRPPDERRARRNPFDGHTARGAARRAGPTTPPPRRAPAAPRCRPAAAGAAARPGPPAAGSSSASGSASVPHRRTCGSSTSAPASASSRSRRARSGRGASGPRRGSPPPRDRLRTGVVEDGRGPPQRVERAAADEDVRHPAGDPTGVVRPQRRRHAWWCRPLRRRPPRPGPACPSPGTPVGLAIRDPRDPRPRRRRCIEEVGARIASASCPSSARASSPASTTSRPSSRTTGTISRTQHDAQPCQPAPAGAGAAAGTPGTSGSAPGSSAVRSPTTRYGVTRTRTSTSTRSSPSGRTAPGRTISARCRPTPVQPSWAGSPALVPGGRPVPARDGRRRLRPRTGSRRRRPRRGPRPPADPAGRPGRALRRRRPGGRQSGRDRRESERVGRRIGQVAWCGADVEADRPGMPCGRRRIARPGSGRPVDGAGVGDRAGPARIPAWDRRGGRVTWRSPVAVGVGHGAFSVRERAAPTPVPVTRVRSGAGSARGDRAPAASPTLGAGRSHRGRTAEPFAPANIRLRAHRRTERQDGSGQVCTGSFAAEYSR